VGCDERAIAYQVNVKYGTRARDGCRAYPAFGACGTNARPFPRLVCTHTQGAIPTQIAVYPKSAHVLRDGNAEEVAEHNGGGL